MLNELKVSYNRDIFNRISGFADSGFDIERDLGIPGQTKDPGDVRPTSISITGCCSVGATDTNRIWDESRRVADTMSFVKGNHSIKIGADWNQLRTARRTVSFVVGDFSFTGVHSGAGLGWADFMLDQPRLIRLGNDPASGASNAGTFPEFKYWRLHEFITDDWKITPNLTMNIGLRHEYVYDAAAIGLAELLARAASQCEIVDVETHRPPIDELVADLYERWQTGSDAG